MSELRELPKPNPEIKEALEAALASEKDLDFIVILGIDRDSGQRMWTSHGNMFQKSFLLAFYQAWVAKWFRLLEE